MNLTKSSENKRESVKKHDKICLPCAYWPFVSRKIMSLHLEGMMLFMSTQRSRFASSLRYGNIIKKPWNPVKHWSHQKGQPSSRRQWMLCKRNAARFLLLSFCKLWDFKSYRSFSSISLQWAVLFLFPGKAGSLLFLKKKKDPRVNLWREKSH